MSLKINRRDLSRLLLAGLAGNLFKSPTSFAAAPDATLISTVLNEPEIPAMKDSILPHLRALETATRHLENTWKPDDPAYKADIYRQVMMNLAFSYFVYFTSDAEHPDWSPLYNPVFACQPNPDDIYLFSRIRHDLTYRVSGNRGTVTKLIFVTQKGVHGTGGSMEDYSAFNSLDDNDFNVDKDGQFEIIFSAKRPEGYKGNWSELKPGADVLFTRARMVDWENEVDPQMSIECLDRVPLKPRLSPEEIIRRIEKMAEVPANNNQLFYPMQNEVKEKLGYNEFDMVTLPGLNKQVYWPAAFSVAKDEALIIETDMPKHRPYWNIQLNDPYYNAVEYVYRFGSINESIAQISSDGKLRVVIAHEDPGTPNWLDPAGFTEGTIYGRWYDCDTTPKPGLKLVKLAQLREHLPKDTPVVTQEERAERLQRRVRAAQRRRRW